MFAYSVEPHEVYSLDEATGEVVFMASTSNRHLAEALGRGDLWLHGGSPAVHVLRNGRHELLSVCHTKEPDTETYRSYAYTFSSSSPYAITAWSDALPLQGKIQMAIGACRASLQEGVLLHDEEGSMLVVSYGSDDAVMRVAEFELETLLGGMHEIMHMTEMLSDSNAAGP